MKGKGSGSGDDSLEEYFGSDASLPESRELSMELSQLGTERGISCQEHSATERSTARIRTADNL
jgi:hypothetical protein